MRMLFVTFWSFDNEAADGIARKIRSEVAAFRALGFAVDLTFVQNGAFWIERGGRLERLCKSRRFITRIVAANALARYLLYAGADYGCATQSIEAGADTNFSHVIGDYDCAYVRYALADMGLLRLVRTLKARGTRVFVEVPTYPYEGEYRQGLLPRASLLLDRLYRGRVFRCVDRAVIYTSFTEVYGVPTVRTSNGLDVPSLPVCKKRGPSERVELIAVAGLSRWHGYDRLIEAMGEYRKRRGTLPCRFHVVGDGAELARYRQLAARYQLEDDVRFYGFLGGAALDEVFDLADAGVGSLGWYRVGAKETSAIKLFEYLARGLPFVYAGRLRELPGLEPYLLEVPNDDTPLSVPDIAAFVRNLYDAASYDDVHALLRARAADLCSMERTLRPVADALTAARPEKEMEK